MSTTKVECIKNSQVPLRFIQPLAPTVTPNIGEDVVLIAAVESVPQAEINWVISNPETARRCEIVPMLDQAYPTRSISQLTIHDFNAITDSGVTVKAVARTADQELVTTCELRAPEEREITEREKPERFIAEFMHSLRPHLEVQETHKVVLECGVQAPEGPVTFKWYWSGIEVSPDTFKEITIERSASYSVLTIERVERKHEGLVTVEVIYPQGEKLVSTCDLHVVPQKPLTEVPLQPDEQTPASVPLRLVQPLQPRDEPTAGEDVVLTASVEAVPQAEITWTISSSETAKRSEVVPLVDEAHPTYTTSQLTVHDFTPQVDESVVVQAIAKTPTEELVTSYALHERRPTISEVVLETGPMHVTPADRPEEVVSQVPLRFIQPLAPTVTPNIGEDVVLIAAVESVPQAEINWVISNPETARRCDIVSLFDESKPFISISQLTLRNFCATDADVFVEAIAVNDTDRLVSSSEIRANDLKYSLPISLHSPQPAFLPVVEHILA
ncbi:hemicentin [Echinococcus granulosus]|uniref:Hemicentin n=1 Tax=Echinococcus granulosus TaxID=6210 RepID=W6UTZ0_ECHGR|nr:hemicentin [Echinococcus granulosus]EUB61842.1 hemicentin [Echinococcus granulosus]